MQPRFAGLTPFIQVHPVTVFFTSKMVYKLYLKGLETVSYQAIVLRQSSNLPLNIQFPCSLANISSLIARYA